MNSCQYQKESSRITCTEKQEGKECLATNAILIVETMPPCIGLGQSKRPKSCTYTNHASLSSLSLYLSLSLSPSLSGLASAD